MEVNFYLQATLHISFTDPGQIPDSIFVIYKNISGNFIHIEEDQDPDHFPIIPSLKENIIEKEKISLY